MESTILKVLSLEIKQNPSESFINKVEELAESIPANIYVFKNVADRSLMKLINFKIQSKWARFVAVANILFLYGNNWIVGLISSSGIEFINPDLSKLKGGCWKVSESSSQIEFVSSSNEEEKFNEDQFHQFIEGKSVMLMCRLCGCRRIQNDNGHVEWATVSLYYSVFLFFNYILNIFHSVKESFWKHRVHPFKKLSITCLDSKISTDDLKVAVRNCSEVLELRTRHDNPIQVLQDLYETISSSNSTSLQVKINISKPIEVNDLFYESANWDFIRAKEAFLVSKVMDYQENVSISNLEIFFDTYNPKYQNSNNNELFNSIIQENELVDFNDYYLFNRVVAVRGVISKNTRALDETLMKHLSEFDQTCLVIPKRDVTLFRWINFEFLKKLTKMWPKKIHVDIPLEEWSGIEYLWDSDCILKIPSDCNLTVEIFPNIAEIKKREMDRNSKSESKSISSMVHDGFLLYVKFFLQAGCNSLKLCKVSEQSKFIEVIGLLMEKNELHSLDVDCPNYILALVVLSYMITHKNLSNLKIFADGKDFLNECIRERGIFIIRNSLCNSI